jgi:hypothetical protein
MVPSIFFVATREKCTFYAATSKSLDIHISGDFATYPFLNEQHKNIFSLDLQFGQPVAITVCN